MRLMLFLIFVYPAQITGKLPLKDLHQKVLNMPDLKVICKNLNSTEVLSNTCREQLEIVCTNVTLFITMFDASSRYPFTGLRFGSNSDLGNFDQCLSIDHTENGVRILGEHCTEGLAVPDYFGDPSDPNFYAILAVCRPDGCDANDYNELVLDSIDAHFPEAFLDDYCQSVKSRKPFGTVDKITLAIFGIIIFLMIISTIHDFYLERKKLSSTHPLLLAFSMLSNGRKLFQISTRSTSKEHVEVLQGLRVLSMMWIVAGHGFMPWLWIPVSNESEWGKGWASYAYAGYINTAHLAVDTFFYIAGFLVAFQYMKYKKKSLFKQLLSVPAMYIHRYLRLTPALLIIYLVVISLFSHLGSGPLWYRHDDTVQYCRENWWAVFLYMQNYNNYDDVCMAQTWFLSAVMQMFIISPIILLPISFVLRKSNGLKYSLIILTILNIFCVLGPMAHKIVYSDYDNEYDTHSRFIDYFMGMMLGIFMRENIENPFLHMVREHRKRVINVLMWLLSITFLLLAMVLFQLVHIYDHDGSKFVFHSLLRPLWCFGLSWIVYSCYHGYGGPVSWILSIPFYQVLGRLTYSIYLVHQSIIDYNTYTTRSPWYFTDYQAFYLFCGHYSVSIIIAIFWTLAFESPLIVVEKYLRKEKTIADKPATSENTDEANCSMQNGIVEELECGELYKRNKDLY